MAVLAQCSYLEAKEYVGKSLTTKIANKKHSVNLMVSCDDYNLMDTISLVRSCFPILVLEYIGSSDNPEYKSLTKDKLLGCYMVCVVDVGNNFTEDDLDGILEDTPSCVHLVVRLPEDFTDIEKLWRLRNKYNTIRFLGKDMWSLVGLRLGYFGQSFVEKKKLKVSDDLFVSYDKQYGVDVLPLDGLELSITEGKAALQIRSKKSGSSTKRSRFTGLIYSEGKVEL